jgi:ribosomal protein L44E
MASIHTITYQCDYCKKQNSTTKVVRNKVEFRSVFYGKFLDEICDQCAELAKEALVRVKRSVQPK